MRLRTLVGAGIVAVAMAAGAGAQGGSNNGGATTLTVPVGQTSATQTATLTFTAATPAGTPFAMNVLTQGSPGLDFNVVNGGTCSTTATYAVGATCTVLYSFSPLSPGARYGGVSLTAGTTVLANTYLKGTGVGPQITFTPPPQSQHGGGISYPSEFAMDGAGNIFVINFFSPATITTSSLEEIPAGCNNAGCVQYLYDFSSFGPALLAGRTGPTGGSVYGIALDGSGNLFVAFDYPPDGTAYSLWELPKGCTNRSCAKGLGDDISPNGGYGQPLAITVDGDGNVYASVADTTGPDMEEIIKVPSGCASAVCVSVISGPYPYVTFSIFTDQNDDLFFLGTANNSASGDTVLYEVPNGCAGSSCTVQALPPGLNYGGNGTLDNNGNFFFSNANYVYEVPVGCRSASCEITLNPQSPFQYAPQILTDARGNVYALSDDNIENAVLELNLTDPPTVTFPTTAQGQVSPATTLTIGNNGNAPLAFAPSILQANPTLSQYFQLDNASAGTCGALIAAAVSPTLSAGQSCAMPLAFAPLAPALGSITGTSVITDDSLNVANSSQTIHLIGDAVLPGTTSTTITSSANPVYAGVGFTLTARVTSVSGTPTGSVTFTDGATVLATVAVNGTGGASGATYAATFLAPGVHTVVASYAPTGVYLASSATLSEQVNADVAVARLSATPGQALVNTPVTLSVAMAASPVGATPAGTITFTSNGIAIDTATIVNGVASYATTALPAGTDALSCSYSGDAQYSPASCNTVNEGVLATAETPRLSLVSSSNPAAAFAPLSFTATLEYARTFLGGEQIAFAIDGVAAGTATTNSRGVAILPLPYGLAPGAHTVTASSASTGIYAGAGAAVTETVNFALSTATLTVSPASTNAGTPVTLTAVVAGQVTTANGTSTPTGTVTFYDNGTALTTATISPNGVASVAVTSLPVGTDTIGCGYSGDANFAASNCNSVAGTVIQPADFTVSVTPSVQTVDPGGTAVYAVTVTGVNGAFTLPVALSVAGVPPGATASFASGTVTPGPGGASTTLTVTTSPNEALLRRADGGYYALLWLPMVCVAAAGRRLRRGAWVLTLLVVCAVTLNGCGGGYFGPPLRAYTLTVTGTSGTLSHGATAGLSVR